MKKSIVAAIGLLCLAGMITTPGLWADGGEGADIILPHDVPSYPQALRETDSAQYASKTVFLTKESLEKVKVFYAAHLIQGDLLETYSEETQEGFNLIYKQKIGKQDKELVLVTVLQYKQHHVFPVLEQMKTQVLKGIRKEAEYADVEKQYGKLARAYFKRVLKADGKSTDEGTAIYEKYFRIAYPKQAALGDAKGTRPKSDQSADKARAVELKKQMQVLKAKKDFTGMLKLSREMQNQFKPDSDVEAVMEESGNDTWDSWLQCLKEMEAAAWWTKIVYAPNVLKE
jgi:hypothetical protein